VAVLFSVGPPEGFDEPACGRARLLEHIPSPCSYSHCFFLHASVSVRQFLVIRQMLPQVIHKPGSVSVHKKFKAEIYVLNKEEGGRHTPFFSNYR